MSEPIEFEADVCCKCGRGDKLLLSLAAAGIVYMCCDCIEAEEKRTGKQGIFCYWKGLVFADDEGLERIKRESEALSESMERG